VYNPPPFIVLADEDFHPGIVGLLAGKLTELTGRPSLIAHTDGDTSTGSLRSRSGYNVVEGLARQSKYFTSFGGHAQAAGCTFKTANIGPLTELLCVDVETNMTAEELEPRLVVNAVLEPEDITMKLVRQLEQLEPFGMGNPEPKFLIENVELTNVKRVGKEGKHLQAKLAGNRLVGFGLSKLKEHLDDPVDIVCKLGVDSWRGESTPQIYLEDVRSTVPSPVISDSPQSALADRQP
jgi:single-stranded-DNA-specific exonuclease